MGESQSARFSIMSGKDADHSKANGKRKSQIREFQQSNEQAELSGIDGEPIVEYFSGFTLIEILRRIQGSTNESRTV